MKQYREMKPGYRFGQWTVVALGKHGIFTMADCRCTCGTKRRMSLIDIHKKKSLSCKRCWYDRIAGKPKLAVYPDGSRASKRLHAKRLSLHLSQKLFGQLFGIHRITVSRWEQGKHPVPAYVTKAASKLKKGKR